MIGNPQVMVQFCQKRLYSGIVTIYCHLLLWKVRMQMDSELKYLVKYFSSVGILF